MTDKELLMKLTDKELVNALIESCDDVAHYADYGYWGDGKLEIAKAERKLIKRLILERMERGNV